MCDKTFREHRRNLIPSFEEAALQEMLEAGKMEY